MKNNTNIIILALVVILALIGLAIFAMSGNKPVTNKTVPNLSTKKDDSMKISSKPAITSLPVNGEMEGGNSMRKETEAPARPTDKVLEQEQAMAREGQK
jgi:flagellar basal body-associated protein FliL